MNTDIKKVAAVGVLAFVALWFLTDALPDGLKEPIREKMIQVLMLAVAAALLAVGAFGLPTWAALAGGAAVLGAAGALPTVRKLADGYRDGDPGQYLECGDVGTCGAWIDGAVCLHSGCRFAGGEEP